MTHAKGSLTCSRCSTPMMGPAPLPLRVGGKTGWGTFTGDLFSSVLGVNTSETSGETIWTVSHFVCTRCGKMELYVPDAQSFARARSFT